MKSPLFSVANFLIPYISLVHSANHYTGYVLGYKQNTGEVYIIQTKEAADLQTVCFSGLGVAGKALDKYGHEYKRLVSTAPYNKLFK